MAEKEKDVKVKPKSPLVRLNGSSSPKLPGRLPGSNLYTFKAPRDLTLGAAQAKGSEKKKFVPNLNVTRKIKTEPDSNNIKSEKTGENKHGERRKNFKKEKPEKQVKKERPQLVQTTGSIFSEGVGSGTIRRRTVSGTRISGGGGEGGISQSRVTTSSYSKEEEEERLRELMRDDFIDDLKSGDSIPVQLPMITTGRMFQESVETVKVKTEVDTGDDVKPVSRRGVGVIDSDDDDDAADPDDVKPPTVQAPLPAPATELSVGDLIKTRTGDLFFIQLPDHLPGLKVNEEGEGRGGSCQLEAVEEGEVGRLQIRRSGACQLVLGQQVLDVEVGTRVGFLQDAVSVELPETEGERGKMTMLGHVKQRLVVTPNWDHLMDNSGLCSTLA